MKILFLGTSSFSVGVLKKLLESKHEVVAVICQPDRPAGRGNKILSPEIKPFALEHNLKVLQYEKVNNYIDEIFKLNFDLFVTASFGQIISREFLSRGTGLNVHPSKLPKYRGATPLQYALLNGDTETAVTIQKMEYEVDSGDIILCEDIKIDNDDTLSTLSEKTAKLGGELLVKALDMFENKTVKFFPQNSKYASFTKMIKKEDGLLDFSKSTEELINKVRALGENPGCYFYVGGDRIKTSKLTKFSDEFLDEGKILIKHKKFLIGAKNGIISVEKCQAPNGKMLNAVDFLNGYKFKSDKVNICY